MPWIGKLELGFRKESSDCFYLNFGSVAYSPIEQLYGEKITASASQTDGNSNYDPVANKNWISSVCWNWIWRRWNWTGKVNWYLTNRLEKYFCNQYRGEVNTRRKMEKIETEVENLWNWILPICIWLANIPVLGWRSVITMKSKKESGSIQHGLPDRHYISVAIAGSLIWMYCHNYSMRKKKVPQRIWYLMSMKKVEARVLMSFAFWKLSWKKIPGVGLTVVLLYGDLFCDCLQRESHCTETGEWRCSKDAGRDKQWVWIAWSSDYKLYVKTIAAGVWVCTCQQRKAKSIGRTFFWNVLPGTKLTDSQRIWLNCSFTPNCNSFTKTSVVRGKIEKFNTFSSNSS